MYVQEYTLSNSEGRGHRLETFPSRQIISYLSDFKKYFIDFVQPDRMWIADATDGIDLSKKSLDRAFRFLSLQGSTPSEEELTSFGIGARMVVTLSEFCSQQELYLSKSPNLLA